MPPESPARLTRSIQTLALAGAAALTMATPAAAQTRWPAYGLVGGYAFRAPDAFGRNNLCPAKGSGILSVREIVPLGRSFATEVSVEGWTGAPHATCISSPDEPPPANGDFTRTFYRSQYTGYPFIQTGFRLTAMPFAGRGFDLRLSAGISRAWSRHLWIPEAALGAVVGHGKTRGILEVGAARYSIPLTTTVDTYQAGAVVHSTSTDKTVRTVSVIARLGVVISRPASRRGRSRRF